MPEPTRRDVLKTGAAAAVAGLAGCSDVEDSSSNPTNSTEGNSTDPSAQEQSAEASYEDELELFDKSIDRKLLEDQGAKAEDSLVTHESFSVDFPKKIGETISGEIPRPSKPGVYIIEGLSTDDVNYDLNQPSSVRSINYNLDNEEVVSGLVDAGFERDFENENIDSRDWELLIDRNTDFDDIAAVKDSTAIILTSYEESPNTNDFATLLDYEEGTQIAIDTHDGEIDSYIEADHREGDIMRAVREFMNGDLEELDNPHRYEATVDPDPIHIDNDDAVGKLTVDRYEESGALLRQNFEFIENEGSYEPENPEIDPKRWTAEELKSSYEEN